MIEAKEIVLIRGLPGTGKSTLAKQIVAENKGYHHVEADTYFIGDDGYVFNPSKIKDAHIYCQAMTADLIKANRSVVVSNTFSQFWEMKPYYRIASEYGVSVRVITMYEEYGSIHNVPEDIIQKMRDRWES